MSYIQTYSGLHFDLLDPKPEQIDIIDIAVALSNICRFTGHLADHYSVAQHSVLASYLVPPELAMEALMHDAAEAYIGDVSAPLKALLPDYREVEHRVTLAIAHKFNLLGYSSPHVKQADMIMLATECRDLLCHDNTDWPCLAGVEPTVCKITHVTAHGAREWFLERYYKLLRDAS